MKTSFFIVCEKEVFLIGKQVKRMEVHKKSNAWALFPLLLFVALFLGVGIITGDFTSMPFKCCNYDNGNCGVINESKRIIC